jgi:hypothetical protein
MNFVEQANLPGELWLRSPNGAKDTANNVLSGVYVKYSQYSSFYSELTSNSIRRFDTFYDCLFVETESGCFFEKIVIENNSIQSFNRYSQFTPHSGQVPGYAAFNTRPGYWFDDVNNLIYHVILTPSALNINFSSRFYLNIHVKIFDCNTNDTKTVLLDQLVLILKEPGTDWSTYNYALEDPCLTFNSSTKHFNISFLIKNIPRQTGIISINFKSGDSKYYDDFVITEVNGHIPFFKVDLENTITRPFFPGLIYPIHILTVDPQPTKNDKAIQVLSTDFKKYLLVLE